MKSRTILFLVVIGLMALNGCASIEIALGFRMRLDKIPVTSVSASLSPTPGLAPGKSA